MNLLEISNKNNSLKYNSNINIYSNIYFNEKNDMNIYRNENSINNNSNYSYNINNSNNNKNNTNFFLLNIKNNNINNKYNKYNINNYYNNKLYFLNNIRNNNDEKKYCSLLSFKDNNFNDPKNIFFLNIDNYNENLSHKKYSYSNNSKNLYPLFLNQHINYDFQKNSITNSFNELENNFHSCKEKLKIQLLEIHMPNKLESVELKNNNKSKDNINYNYLTISEKIKALKKDLENSLINIKNKYYTETYNKNIIDDIKDLIYQIDSFMKRIISVDETSESNKKNINNSNNINNSYKKNKRIPKIWKIHVPESRNDIINNNDNNISNQKLKCKESQKSNISKENNNIKHKTIKNNKNLKNKIPLSISITNNKNFKNRQYNIDFEKFYSLIENAQDILHTMNKYEKSQHDQNFQILYKMCNAK